MTDLDRLIDDVARDMTAAPAPVDLGDRVLNRIRGEAKTFDEARASYYKHLWWLAAAAALVLAAYLQLGRSPDEGGSDQPGRSKDRPLQTVDRRDTTPVLPKRSEGPVVRPGQRDNAGRLGGPVSPTRLEGPVFRPALQETIASLPALDAPEALTIAPLDASTAQVPALGEVAPLDIGNLDIKSLTPPR